MERKACYLFHDYSDYNSHVIREMADIDGVSLVRDYLPASAGFLKRSIYKARNELIRKAPRLLFPWMSRMLCPSWFRKEKCPYKAIILYEGNAFLWRPDFLNYFKKRYPEIKLVFLLTNIIGSYPESAINGRVPLFASLFDAIITYDADDAAQNGLLYYEGMYSPPTFLSESEKAADPQYDLYFCGLDKGRLQHLLDIYDLCASKGLACRFDIVYPEAESPRDGISYHASHIPYEEMILRSCSARALLELLSSPSRRGTTLRPYEAYALHKKIVTNNQSIKEKEWYNKSQIKILEHIEDIDPDWIRTPIPDNEAYDIENLSPKHFIDFLDSSLFE